MKAFVIKIQKFGVWWAFDQAVFPVYALYTIRHFTNFVELICNSQPFFRSRDCYILTSHWQDTWNRLSFSDSQKCKDKWHKLRSNYMRERRKSKEKNIRKWGYGEREMAILWCREILLEYYLQRRTMEMFQRQQLQLKFHSLIQMKLKSATLNNWKEKI